MKLGMLLPRVDRDDDIAIGVSARNGSTVPTPAGVPGVVTSSHFVPEGPEVLEVLYNYSIVSVLTLSGLWYFTKCL